MAEPQYYRLSEAAKDDLNRIYKWGVERFGEAQADQYYYEIFNRFLKAGKNPERCPSANHIRVGYRKCAGNPDTIYFKIAADGMVEIMRIIGNQDLKKIK